MRESRLINVRNMAGPALLGLILAVAGCQSGDVGTALGIGSKSEEQQQEQEKQKVLASDLLAFCPKVTLREGTAYYTTYAKGGDGDKKQVIYQASITDVTRSCARGNGMLTITVAVAGRVIMGPKGTAGTITMPIRVAAIQGADVLYSQIHQFQVAIPDTSAATQFVFSDPAVTMPIPQGTNIQVFAGYDEGPPKSED